MYLLILYNRYKKHQIHLVGISAVQPYTKHSVTTMIFINFIDVHTFTIGRLPNKSQDSNYLFL